MKRAERQYALVDLLRGARRPWSAARLAAEFEVSGRTIERDVAALQAAGVPVYADTGRGGGYSILPEYSLPPLALTGAEAAAVLAGLALLESSPFESAAHRAGAKIAAVVDDRLRAPVQDVLGTVRTVDPTVASVGGVPPGMLSDVVAARRVVRLTYLGADADGGTDPATRTERVVETFGVLRAEDAWWIAGWCRLRDGVRGFRTDRIAALEVLDEVAPDRDPAVWERDLAQWPTRRLGVRSWDDRSRRVTGETKS